MQKGTTEHVEQKSLRSQIVTLKKMLIFFQTKHQNNDNRNANIAR